MPAPKIQTVTHLLRKDLPGTFREVPTQPTDKAHSKVSLVPDVMKMGQSVVHHTYQAGLHHQVVLSDTEMTMAKLIHQLILSNLSYGQVSAA